MASLEAASDATGIHSLKVIVGVACRWRRGAPCRGFGVEEGHGEPSGSVDQTTKVEFAAEHGPGL